MKYNSVFLRSFKCFIVCGLLTLSSTLSLTTNDKRPNTRTKPSQPNIVFVLADDYGWNDVGYHGSEIKTPTLDRLAADGVKLDNYYVQPICSPTRSQLLSGRYQIHTGLQHGIIWAEQPNGLPLELPTIADKLREVGYATHAVGKWHLGFYKEAYMPLHRGFDSYYGYLTGSVDYLTYKRCTTITPKEVCALDLHDGDKPVWNETGVYSTQLFTSRAEKIITDHAKQSPDKPLFLYLPYQAVHSPLQVPQRYLDQYKNIKDHDRRIYAGMVSCMDEGVQNITKTLEKFDMWKNTVFIFSTDNGGQILDGGNNWPLRGWKGSLWEGGMRGVGFVNSPLLKYKGQVRRGLMHVSDWFPTLVHLAGGNTTGLKLDGHDIWRAISEGGPSPRKELLHNIDPMYQQAGERLFNNTFDTRVRAAVRVNNWKLITGDPGNSRWVPPPHVSADTDDTLRFVPKKNVWLFDVATDPWERHDLSDKRPDIVKSLLERLAFYNSTAVPVRYPPMDPNCDPSKHGGVWSPWQH
ncbi:hypothetical protein NP493_1683g00022 [Ridgeia piscesae]|uniref:Sulfatase N-terminal domain-containing protein n=1 Tax=Ridgeia piscesae TaxID=27915 RepID=A0AAD9N7D3_RIDPI|nr:hypothetical protein NP493_1683g00022 [Ridgeia piscesae]